MQTHAVERQFKNLIFNILLLDQCRYFNTIHLYSFNAHNELTRRLQDALDLLAIRCVDQNLQRRCTYALDMMGVVLHECVCSSRPVHLLHSKISNEDIRSFFHNVKKHVEAQCNTNDRSLNFLEIMLAKLCSKKDAVETKSWCYQLEIV